MSDAMGAVKRVPKWAWIASVGVVGGVAVMKMRSNKGAQVDKAPADGTAVADYGLTAAPIGTGVVAAGTGSTGYTGDIGSPAAPFDYAGFLDSISGFAATLTPDWANILDTVESGNVGIISAVGALPGYAGGGGAPESSTTQQPPAAPTPPAPAPPPAVAPQQYTRTVDNGKSGKDRKVWCMCGSHKVADGACWAEGHACT